MTPMTFADLQPGDEIMVRISGTSKGTCRARVREHCGDTVMVVLWNSIAERWNRNPRSIKSEQVVQYPEGR
jgi:hypothetical protein